MNIIKSIIIFSIIIQILSSNNKNSNKVEGKITDGKIKYSVLNIKPEYKDLIISSKLISSKESEIVPVYLVSTHPFSTDNKNRQFTCGKIGEKDCVIPRELLRYSRRIYIAAYCESCEYSFEVNYNNQNKNAEEIKKQNANRKLLNLPEIRLLQANPSNQQIAGRVLAGDDKFLKLRGLGVCGVLYLIIFIIVCIIGCYIMMNIYVNTKLINTPLKLGKIEN